MHEFHRYITAISAVLFGLPLLLSSLLQSATGVGYSKRPTDQINASFLDGSASFLNDAVSDHWLVGYGRNDLTPDDLDKHDYYLGGYLMFPAQSATDVIDDLCVRAVVLDDCSGRGAAAFAWVDGVGLMNADIKAIRARLTDITGAGQLISIDVGATHTHSGIDTQGLWGTIPKSGRDPKYLNSLIEKTADAIRTAYENRSSGTLFYASKVCREMFNDGRNPQVFDEKVHLFRFVPEDDGKKEIFIANFGAHPTNYDADNTALSGDYPYYIEKRLAEQQNADFIFVQGAIGGGIGCDLSERNGIPQSLEKYDKLLVYSEKMTDILVELAQNGVAVEPILNVRHAQVEFELDNFVFKLAERAGLCNAKAYRQEGKTMLTSEIGYVEIGNNIKILEMPGEAFPEIVYGGFYSASQAFHQSEYPYPALCSLFNESDDILMFGLCNDALGYFVPDNDYSASNKEGHYEETVSTGSGSASALSAAFMKLLDDRA